MNDNARKFCLNSLAKSGNKVLTRIVQQISESKITTAGYSRMHNRHNRSFVLKTK